jgi:hypothetical protein
MNSILMFSVCFHLLLLFFVAKSTVKIPPKFRFLKPLTLSIVSILIYASADIIITNSGAINPAKISYYWLYTFSLSVVWNLIIAFLLEGWDSLKFFVVAQLGIMLGLPDMLWFFLQGKGIPHGQLSWMPFYMNEAWKLYLNFSVIIFLTVLIYVVPYYVHHRYFLPINKERGEKPK